MRRIRDIAAGGLVARARSLWRALRHQAAVEAEMGEEMRHHLELRTEDLMRRGLAPADAARRARVEFGGIEAHREDARAARGLRFFDEASVSWLDVKLGLRMLAKYPGLSIVSVIGMSVAIAIAAGAFGFIQAMMDPTLPLHEGDRIVSVQNNDVRNIGNPDRQSLHLFLEWRDELETVRDLSAVNLTSRTLVVPGGTAELVRVAEMTPSAFTVARVAPILGRTLIDDDERTGAPPVAVIAEEEWRRRFAADPGIVGRSIRLGGADHTVVGVMPAGFRFPLSHYYWVPLRLEPEAHARGGGPQLHMFGRLAGGATLAAARAELATLGVRAAAVDPGSYGHLRPQVLPYTHAFLDIDSPAMALMLRLFQLALALLLVVVAVNVGALIYARTATRMGEIAVRSALGASRRRVIAQLFAEALVLSSLAAAIGLGIASAVLHGVQRFQEGSLNWEFPFWLDLGLSPALIAYVAGLALLAGVIIGVAPALRVTGRRIQPGLQQLASRSSQMQLGRTWSGLIIAQVAIAVALLPFAAFIAVTSTARATAAPGFPADEVLRAVLALEQEEHPAVEDVAAYRDTIVARFRVRAAELLRRLETEPRVTGASFATYFPGQERYGRVEAESGPLQRVRTSDVGVDLLDVLGVPILAGRTFSPADARDDANVVVITQTLADQLTGDGGAVLGRRIRFLRRNSAGAMEGGPWLEIVGVVPDFTVQPDFDPPDGKVYRPMALPQSYTVDIAVRLSGIAPIMFAARLREIAADIDPALQLHEMRSAAAAEEEARKGLQLIAAGVVAVVLSVLLLSAAGVHAMMAFTVNSRRREIGIRSALGARPRRVLGAIFARAGRQLGIGVLCGLAAAVALNAAAGALLSGALLSGRSALLLPGTAALLLTVGLVAALGPARRGLAIQPTEALKEE